MSTAKIFQKRKEAERQDRSTSVSPNRRLQQQQVHPGSSPLYLIVKEHCLVIRAKGVTGSPALDQVLILHYRQHGTEHQTQDDEGDRKAAVDAEVKTFQMALNQGDILGNELEVEIEGILGVISLLSGPYLLTIDASNLVGMAPNYEKIRRITKLGIRPISWKHQEEEGLRGWRECDEKRYLNMLRDPIASGYLYYCHKYPLHQRMQTNFESSQRRGEGEGGNLVFDSSLPYGGSFEGEKENNTIAATGQSDFSSRYLWNYYLLHGLGDRRIQHFWGTACICGFAESRPAFINGDSIVLTLISRRNRRRQGTRFNQRGGSMDGEVANFVETEMILTQPGGGHVAHVQLRGSLPLPWSQPSDLSWQPIIEVHQGGGGRESPKDICAKHFEHLKDEYGSVHIINLIDSCGTSQNSKDQSRLGKIFAECVQELPDYTPISSNPIIKEDSSTCSSKLSFTWFDFHKECSKMRWYRLRILLAQVDDMLATYGYNKLGPGSAEFLEQQSGFFRTNCMDNLDRTNVVQSLLAYRILLRALGLPLPSLITPEDRVEEVHRGLRSFEEAFKHLWVANADALSVLYAGTPALKTDFVLTGRRTFQGLLQDGVNALTRYYINNFWDGRRQDSVALWLGDFQPNPRKPSPFPVYSMPFIPGGAIFTVTYALQDLSPYHLTLHVAAWVAETALLLLQCIFGLSDDSIILRLIFNYLMVISACVALGECLIALGPFQLLKRMKDGRLFVNKPYLGTQQP